MSLELERYLILPNINIFCTKIDIKYSKYIYYTYAIYFIFSYRLSAKIYKS